MSKPLTALSSYQKPPDDWIIPHVLKRRNTGFIIGRPKKAAKSWLLMNLGWDLSDGTNAWSVVHSHDGEILKPTRPMRVFYFSQEDTEDDLHDRFSLMVKAGRIPTNNFWYETKDLSLTLDPNGLGKIIDALKPAAPLDLVMFDPMRRFHSFDENRSDEMSKLWHSVNVIQQKFDCACLFSHHTVKPGQFTASEEDPNSARGSGDIFGGADAFINVVPRSRKGNPKRGALNAPLTLYFEIKRGKPIVPIDLTVDFTTGGVTFDGFTP